MKKIYAAHIEYGYTIKEIADYLGIHYSTVSKVIKNEIKKVALRAAMRKLLLIAHAIYKNKVEFSIT